jgi:orotidine 5'-phosphate decarboxylase subfamily 2
VSTFLDRVARRAQQTGGSLCLGLDPDPASLPPGFGADVQGIEAFARLLIDAAGPHAVAVKANLAFFEALGPDGVAALERVRQHVPFDLPFIADAKRADIGSTAERQATALIDVLGADAVTLNPYLGRDAVEPFLARSEPFVHLVCRTSNPSAAAFQDARALPDPVAGHPEEPFHHRVARVAADWAPAERLGLVVGATAPDQLAALRAVAPDRAFLIPGLGAQGGDERAAAEWGPARSGSVAERPGGGLLVNVSRGIAGAWRGQDGVAVRDPGEAIRTAAAEWIGRIPVLL